MRSRVSFCISALLFLGALFTLGSTLGYAVVPDSIGYQGIVKTAGGLPVADNNYLVTIKIYDVASGPDPALWTETKMVTTIDGQFSTFLGSVTPLPSSVFSGPNRFLGITMSPDPEMIPRTPIVAVPYAYRIATVDGATGGSISGDVAIGSNLTVAGGNLAMDNSSAQAGNITKDGIPFVHNYGNDNTFVGLYAGNLTTSGSGRNTATGKYALFSNSTGNSNTAYGYAALLSNTTGEFNTAAGYGALSGNVSGSHNTACGLSSLRANTTGNYNTANGANALANNTDGNSNTANGYRALWLTTYGSGNTACGFVSLVNNTGGSWNTASGQQALDDNTSGNHNTADGAFALTSNTSGSGNSAIGRDALETNTTGTNNTAIGYSADVSADNLTNASAIGANATVNASNKIRLGNGDITVIEGQVAYTFSSDENMKENFRPVDGAEVLKKIGDLDLTSWNYKGQDPQQFRHYGPMAQEFFAAFGKDDVGTSGTPTTINSGDQVGILMIAVQALEKRTAEVDAIKAENQELRSQIAELRRMITAQADQTDREN